ncbi:hypothetical protein [Albirhodobacter sp. R86504]|uniref:hypothetical protein n=1 Tax=Albirhodobacter sp. R86504 TaxID=3093848 RepID=UPI00366C5AA2
MTLSEARKSDELTLLMLRARASGKSATDIGRIIGKSSQFVSTATVRVMRADMAESGETRRSVALGYWKEARG